MEVGGIAEEEELVGGEAPDDFWERHVGSDIAPVKHHGAVHGEASRVLTHFIARDGGDTLDEQALRVAKVAGEDDVAAGGRAPPVGQAVDKDALAGEQRWLHAPAAHGHALPEEQRWDVGEAGGVSA